MHLPWLCYLARYIYAIHALFAMQSYYQKVQIHVSYLIIQHVFTYNLHLKLAVNLKTIYCTTAKAKLTPNCKHSDPANRVRTHGPGLSLGSL